jgi:hypothetical protein
MVPAVFVGGAVVEAGWGSGVLDRVAGVSVTVLQREKTSLPTSAWRTPTIVVACVRVHRRMPPLTEVVPISHTEDLRP